MIKLQNILNRKEIANFDDWDEIDQAVSQLEETQDDLKNAQSDVSEKKREILSELNETKEKLGSF